MFQGLILTRAPRLLIKLGLHPDHDQTEQDFPRHPSDLLTFAGISCRT